MNVEVVNVRVGHRDSPRSHRESLRLHSLVPNVIRTDDWIQAAEQIGESAHQATGQIVTVLGGEKLTFCIADLISELVERGIPVVALLHKCLSGNPALDTRNQPALRLKGRTLLEELGGVARSHLLTMVTSARVLPGAIVNAAETLFPTSNRKNIHSQRIWQSYPFETIT